MESVLSLSERWQFFCVYFVFISRGPSFQKYIDFQIRMCSEKGLEVVMVRHYFCEKSEEIHDGQLKILKAEGCDVLSKI